MKHLISNGLNEKSIISNIQAGTLNKVILLTGVYGTGKSEFSKEIARMITCEDFSSEGYCGKCEACTSEIAYGLNSFNASITFLNMQKISYDEMAKIVVSATTKVRNKKEVFIFDEFHLVKKDAQELWLAETAKLDDCYLIMTTTDKRSITDGILSRTIQVNMKQLAPLEATQLIRQHYPQASDKVIQAFMRKFGGNPREIITHSVFYENSGLEDEEIIEHLTNVNQQEVITCLEAMSDRELFFEELKVVRSMNTYTVKKILQDLLWDWIGMTPQDRIKVEYLHKYSEAQIMKFLITSKDDPLLTILNMFSAVTARTDIRSDMQNISKRKEPVEVKVSAKEEFTKEEKW